MWCAAQVMREVVEAVVAAVEVRYNDSDDN
jgi:hypothetical protein